MRPYYVDLGQKDVMTGWYDLFVFDDEGIPQYPYPSGLAYNVTFVCHYGLYRASLYERFRCEEDLHAFLRVADWICRCGEETEAGFVVPYTVPKAGLQSPWISALGQGRMLSVLTRAFEATGDPAYLDVARKAMRPFEKDVAEGGVRSAFPDGGIGFEEYPFEKPNLVLNGFVTALFGLYDLAEIGADVGAQALFNAGVGALENNLYQYDLGYWSAYDLSGPIRRVASDEYHHYHVIQLWALYEMTGCEMFKSVCRKWQAYPRGLRLHVRRNVSRIHTRLRGAR